jgi:formyltetrahydrofolate dehydrogenase
VSLIAEGKAPKIPQTEEGASYEPMLNKKESSMVRLDELTGQQLHDFIRGCDKVPGAWITLDEQEVKLYGSKQWTQDIPNGLEVKVLGIEKKKIFRTSKFSDLKKGFNILFLRRVQTCYRSQRWYSLIRK